MGKSGVGSLSPTPRAASKAIDRELKKERRRQQRQVKLLLLGAGESGKSTVVKQMKLLHGGGFTEAERLEQVDLVHANIIDSMSILYSGARTMGLDLGDPVLAQEADEFFERLNPTVTRAAVPLFCRLWADSSIQEAYRRRAELNLGDGAVHYMANLARFGEDGYVPTDQDILYARLPTRGVSEYHFATPDGVDFNLIDVGGQKVRPELLPYCYWRLSRSPPAAASGLQAERRKWFGLFDDVAAIIFVVASNDFDRISRETESGANRLKESLKLFSHIMKGKQLADKTVVLFFNKTDLLTTKISEGKSVGAHFPDFPGPEGDLAAYQQWLISLFRAEFKTGDIYPHFTTAVDSDNIKHVFEDVKDTILHHRLREMHLFT